MVTEGTFWTGKVAKIIFFFPEAILPQNFQPQIRVEEIVSNRYVPHKYWDSLLRNYQINPATDLGEFTAHTVACIEMVMTITPKIVRNRNHHFHPENDLD